MNSAGPKSVISDTSEEIYNMKIDEVNKNKREVEFL